MGILPQDSKDQQRLLGIILGLAAGSLFFLYVHRPRASDLNDLEERVADMEAQNEIARTRTENLDALREQLVIAERRFSALERLVPTGEEIAEIYDTIASESEALSLDLRNVVPAEAQPDAAGYFMRQNWEMEVEGAYHDVGAFLTRVASFDRIVRPVVREIRPVEGPERAGQPVTALFELETFVLGPATGASGEEADGDE